MNTNTEKLTREEEMLLDKFRTLNHVGRGKALDYVQMLFDTGTYRKGVISFRYYEVGKNVCEL